MCNNMYFYLEMFDIVLYFYCLTRYYFNKKNAIIKIKLFILKK